MHLLLKLGMLYTVGPVERGGVTYKATCHCCKDSGGRDRVFKEISNLQMHLASAAHIKRAKEHDPSSQSGTVKESLRRVGLQTLITAAARTVHVLVEAQDTWSLRTVFRPWIMFSRRRMVVLTLNPKPYNPKPLR